MYTLDFQLKTVGCYGAAPFSSVVPPFDRGVENLPAPPVENRQCIDTPINEGKKKNFNFFKFNRNLEKSC